MYIPPAHAQTDPETLFAFIRQYGFAVLVSQHDGGPFATHLPLLADRSAAAHGRLVGHMARANPQWQQADGQTVLAIFSGPHAYVSPTWYEAENVVPTWNYAAVHVYGTFRAVHDEAAVMQIVRETVDFYESPRSQPWRLDPETDFTRKMVKAVVGFTIDVTRVEGKWKLSQNHPQERRRRVMLALRDAEDQDAREISAMMSDLAQ